MDDSGLCRASRLLNDGVSGCLSHIVFVSVVFGGVVDVHQTRVAILRLID